VCLYSLYREVVRESRSRGFLDVLEKINLVIQTRCVSAWLCKDTAVSALSPALSPCSVPCPNLPLAEV